MKKRLVIALLLGVFILVGALYISLKLSQSFKVWFFASWQSEVLPDRELETFELSIAQTVIDKFDRIYSYYYGERFNSPEYREFLKVLNADNDWEQASLKFSGKVFPVEVKLHGRSPAGHVEGNYYSLGVRVKGDGQIKGVNRFNLIVYGRVKSTQDIIAYLAQKLGLFYQEAELVALKINDKPEKLYYFEFRPNTDFLKKMGKGHWVVLKWGSDHSLVYTGGDSLKAWDARLDSAINKYTQDTLFRALLTTHYRALNEAIFKRDVDQVMAYFEEGELVRIQAFRYIYGDSGHGFGPENLLLAFDTATLKFHPILHRDHESYERKAPFYTGPFDGSNLGRPSPLLETLGESERLAEGTEAMVREVLGEGKVRLAAVDSICAVHDGYNKATNLMRKWGVGEEHFVVRNIRLLEEEVLR